MWSAESTIGLREQNAAVRRAGMRKHPQACAPLQFGGRRRDQGVARRRSAADKVRCPGALSGLWRRWIGRG